MDSFFSYFFSSLKFVKKNFNSLETKNKDEKKTLFNNLRMKNKLLIKLMYIKKKKIQWLKVKKKKKISII